MKICPICKTQYSDEAEYCAKCKALLETLPKKEEKVPVDFKRLAKAIISTFAFIGGIYLMLYLLSKIQ